MREALEFLVAQGTEQVSSKSLPEQVVAFNNNYTLHDIEDKLPAPLRYRTKINTHSLPDFVTVSKETDTENKACFVDDETMSAKTLFNLGSIAEPGHGDHQAKLKLRKTAEFIAVNLINGSQQEQQAMAEWLEDWREFLIPVWADGEVRDMAKAINVVRNVTIDASKKTEHSVSDFGAEKSDLEQIEARGRDLPPPAQFKFKCVTYTGLGEREISLRLSIRTGQRPAFVLRIVREDSLIQEIAEEFAELLTEKMEGIPVTIGTINK